MEVGNATNRTSNNISDGGVSQAVAIAMQKKTMDIEKEHAAALIQSIPQTQNVPNLPSHLGKNINTTA